MPESVSRSCPQVLSRVIATTIGDSRWTVFPGVDIDPQPYNVSAQDPPVVNEKQLGFLQAYNEYWDAESTRTLFLESSLTELFTTMLAKFPADRPSAHQVLQFLNAPASIGKPCGGCLADEARGEILAKTRSPLVIPEPTPNAGSDWSPLSNG